MISYGYLYYQHKPMLFTIEVLQKSGEEGPYWDVPDGVTFVFSRSEILSSFQYFNGGRTGIRLLDSSWEDTYGEKPGAALTFDQHPDFLILADDQMKLDVEEKLDQWLVKKDEFSKGFKTKKAAKAKRQEWINRHLVDTTLALTKAKKYLAEYFLTPAGIQTKTKLQTELEKAKRSNTNPALKAYFDLVSTEAGLIQFIVDNPFAPVKNRALLKMFTTFNASDSQGRDQTFGPVELILAKNMSDWLGNQLYTQFPHLKRDSVQILPTGNIYESNSAETPGEIPLYKSRLLQISTTLQESSIVF